MKRAASGIAIALLCTIPLVGQNLPPVGGGTVTSVGLAGTPSQMTVTGPSPITGAGLWTLSFPAGGVTLPGTTTGAFNGPLTGNVTGTATALASTPTKCSAGKLPSRCGCLGQCAELHRSSPRRNGQSKHPQHPVQLRWRRLGALRDYDPVYAGELLRNHSAGHALG